MKKMRLHHPFHIGALLLAVNIVSAQELAGHKLLLTSVRTGNTELFVVDPVWGDAQNVSRSPSSEERYACWSPDGKQIVFSKNVGRGLELYLVNPDGSNLRQLTRFGEGTICTPAAWSPDGEWISFRFTDERYWSDPVRMKKVYREKPADKRPVWIIRPDGTDARVIECLRFQCAMDGSRAAWKPR